MLSPWADVRPLLRRLHWLPVVGCRCSSVKIVIKRRLVVVWKTNDRSVKHKIKIFVFMHESPVRIEAFSLKL